MQATITMDSAGRLVLPKAMRDRLHLRQGARLKAEVIADKIELTPTPDAGVRVERRGKRLLIIGSGAVATNDAAAAVRAAREEYDERLAGKFRRKS